MLEIEIKELVINTELKKKIEMICKFASTKPTIINGSLRNIKKTNVAYIEPHRIIINNITYFMFYKNIRFNLEVYRSGHNEAVLKNDN